MRELRAILYKGEAALGNRARTGCGRVVNDTKENLELLASALMLLLLLNQKVARGEVSLLGNLELELVNALSQLTDFLAKDLRMHRGVDVDMNEEMHRFVS